MEVDGSGPISPEECWQLLATVPIGRLGLSLDALPAIVPVQFAVDDRELAICLGHYDLSERAVDDAVVAFAADSFDATTREGWVVQVRGRARVAQRAGLPADCGQPDGGPMIRVAPVTITGDRVRLCAAVSPLER